MCEQFCHLPFNHTCLACPLRRTNKKVEMVRRPKMRKTLLCFTLTKKPRMLRRRLVLVSQVLLSKLLPVAEIFGWML